jgi:hypothetical protein
MARLWSMIAVLKPFSSRYALSALRSHRRARRVSVRILQKSSSSRKIRFSMEGDSHVCICTKTWTNFVQCLSVATCHRSSSERKPRTKSGAPMAAPIWQSLRDCCRSTATLKPLWKPSHLLDNKIKVMQLLPATNHETIYE